MSQSPTRTIFAYEKTVAIFMILATIGGFSKVSAQEFTANSIEKISVGFADSARLGHWTPISVQLSAELAENSRPTRFEINCQDGEGTPVSYRGQLIYDSAHPGVGQAWFRLGRQKSDIRIRLCSDDDSKAQTLELEAGKDYSVTSSTEQIVLAIQGEQLLREMIEIASQNSGGGRIVQAVKSISQLPNNALALQGVDKIYLSTSEASLIDQLSDKQLDALMQWIENFGGHLILSVGQGGEACVGPNGRLARFCPGTFVDVVELESASRLKFFADSQSDLISDTTTLSATKIDNWNGVTQLSQDGIPLIVREARGFGTITFVAIDVDSSTVRNWDGAGSLVRKLFFGEIESLSAEVKTIAGGRVSHYGYNDLIGQLRVPLDQFSRVRFVTFTWVAVLIGLYILCIGPGDYFLLRKVVGRMELTWLTFGLMTLLFCGIAWFTARSAKPNRIQINQLEIIDIDAESGRTRGFVWANLFSPATATHDVSLAPTNRLGNNLDSRIVGWQGLPGNGLGGMQSSANTTLAAEGYSIDMEFDSKGTSTILDRFPLRVSSSRPIFAEWFADNAVRPQSRLRINDRLQGRLDGTFTNPLDRRLINTRLMFEDWVYQVDGALEPGETVSVLTETSERNVRSYFTRRVSKDDKGTNAAWDPTDTQVSRIADMMMFYEAAGGQGYVGLTHGYQGFTDLSILPHLNRAILVGELQEQVTEIVLDGKPQSDNYDQKTTIVRILLPVSRSTRQ